MLNQEMKEIRAKKNAKIWMNAPFDLQTQNAVQSLKEKDFSLFLDSFYKSLDFGTGGLRALMGVGPNRINIYTILQISQGVFYYAREKRQEKASIVIGYDGRHQSKYFAECSAIFFARCGMEVFLLFEPCPTPLISFLTRHLKVFMGVMITASHNSKNYNGYKIYGPDGGQLTPPDDQEVMKHVAMVKQYPVVDVVDIKQWKNIYLLDDNVYQDYFIATADAMSLYKEKSLSQNFSVIYTPLHGVGGNLLAKAMEKENISFSWVEEQRDIDPNFSTITMPNPEDDNALVLAMKKWKKQKSSLLIATDADADRARIGVKYGENYLLLTGNQMAVLLVDYCLSLLQKNNLLPPNGYIAKTIVTTPMVCFLAERYGVLIKETLPGFKYIGSLIDNCSQKFLLGVEDSCGYLVGEHLRDKDGIQLALFACHMVGYWQNKNKNLFDRLCELYLDFGFFEEKIISLEKKDPNDILNIMHFFRNNPLQKISGLSIKSVWDLENGEQSHFDATGSIENKNKFDFDIADVLVFSLSNATEKNSLFSRFLTIVARPSGTEPKIKFYLQLKSNIPNGLTKENLFSFMDEEKKFFQTIENDFLKKLLQEIAPENEIK